MDYDLQRCTRRCAATGRELAEGERFYSVLLARGGDLERLDYAAEAWPGAPENAVAWWQSQVPTREARKAQLAPNEVLLELLASLAEQPEKEDMRFVLALLLVRRRVLRLEETIQEQGSEMMVLHSPRDDSVHRVRSVFPSEARTAEIQAELAGLLFAHAT